MRLPLGRFGCPGGSCCLGACRACVQVGLPCYLVTYDWVKSVTLPADGSKHSAAALMLAGGSAGVRVRVPTSVDAGVRACACVCVRVRACVHACVRSCEMRTVRPGRFSDIPRLPLGGPHGGTFAL